MIHATDDNDQPELWVNNTCITITPASTPTPESNSLDIPDPTSNRWEDGETVKGMEDEEWVEEAEVKDVIEAEPGQVDEGQEWGVGCIYALYHLWELQP